MVLGPFENGLDYIPASAICKAGKTFMRSTPNGYVIRESIAGVPIGGLKIERQKRTILEGSQERDILYRKFSEPNYVRFP